MKSKTELKKNECIPGYPEASPLFEWATTLGSLWILTGLFLDGWAHNNIPDLIDSFFTPWHLVLYSGFGASAAILVIAYVVNVRKGYGLRRALPRVYWLSFLGAVIFGLAGNLDLLWHTLFGIEEDLEALVSPTHLMLAVGGVLIVSGPLRNAWNHSKQGSPIGGPALASLFAVLGIFTFFTQYSNAFAHPNILVGARPVGSPAGDTYFWDVTILSYVLITVTLLMSFILAANLRWKLPIGSLTLLIAGNSTLMFLMAYRYTNEQWPVLIAAVLGGVIADLLLRSLRPSRDRVRALRWFSFLVPVCLFTFYFLALVLTEGIWWNPSMWVGAIFLGGVMGLVMSWIAVSPA